MLRTGPKRKAIYAISGYIYVIAGLMSSGTIWLMDVEKDDKWIAQRPVVWSLIDSFQGIAIWALLAIAAAVVVTGIIKRMADPWVVEKLQFILDEYQGKVFKDLNVPKDHNRVTLFKYRKGLFFRRHWNEEGKDGWWPFKTRRFYGNYLEPYMRSGHLTLKTKTLFFIDNENSARTQGLAGLAWSTRQVALLSELPEIKPSTGAVKRKDYAKVTRSSVRFLERYLAEGKTPPRSMAAVPVECNGKLWGVIVLDSLTPLAVTQESVEHYTLTVALIGHLLERA
ncbi:GAF domain-containing protein [Pseudomonas fluorescens]|uniref:GAF domain-containing protein n=1 Tax=Pseudomonas fluorescens TaxID=294 RepID=UPI0017835E18|nr:GAF domain-containing protein [Pseudomonas fluorescens]